MKYLLKTAVLTAMVTTGVAQAGFDSLHNWNDGSSAPLAVASFPGKVVSKDVPFDSGFDSITLDGNLSGNFGDDSTQSYSVSINGQKDLGNDVRLSTGVGYSNDGALGDFSISKGIYTDRGDYIGLRAGASYAKSEFDFVPAIEFIEGDSGIGLTYSPLGLGFVEIKDGHKYTYSLDPITNAFQMLTGQRTILHALSDALGMKADEMKGREIVVNAKFFGSGHNWNNKPADKDNIKLYVNAAGQVSMVGWC